MERTWDIDYPQKVANAGGKFIKEYLAELRKEGKVKGKISLVIREGQKEIVLDYKNRIRRRPFVPVISASQTKQFSVS